MKPIDRHAEAEWLTRMGRWGAYGVTTVAVLALIFTLVNVQQFASVGDSWHSAQWWIAWLLDPMASITLGLAIVFASILADHGRKEFWLTVAMWFAGSATWAMNVWLAAAAGSLSGIVLHSVAPGLILLLAEAAPRVRRHFGEIRAELLTAADAAPTGVGAERVGESSPTPSWHPGADPAPAGDFPRVELPPTPDPAEREPTHPTDPRPGVELELVPGTHPTPPPRAGDVDPTILAAAQALRDERAAQDLTTGRRVLLAELPTRLPPGYRVTDTTARRLARVLAA